MDRNIFFKPIVYLAIFMSLSYFVIEKLHLDYTIWWIDMMMHFLGGLWEGMFFPWFFSIKNFTFFQISIKDINFKLIFKTIVFVFLIGVLWECFEFLVKNYIGREPFSVLDTTSDVFLDLAGGIVAVLYFFRKTIPTTLNKVQ